MASEGGSGGDSSSTFLTSGSSALILAFLAIGLFVGGLLVMFAMRRYVVLSRRRAGTWEDPGSGPWNWEETIYEPLATIALGRNQREGLGARPELLDVCAVEAASVNWEDIMPVSVTPVIEKASSVPEVPAREDPGPHEVRNTDDRPHASSGHLRPLAFASHIRPLRRRGHSPSPAPSISQPPTPSLPTAAPANRGPSQLRVVLAIAMPTQQQPTSGVPPYALGISDVKWDGGPLDDLRCEGGVEYRVSGACFYHLLLQPHAKVQPSPADVCKRFYTRPHSLPIDIDETHINNHRLKSLNARPRAAIRILGIGATACRRSDGPACGTDSPPLRDTNDFCVFLSGDRLSPPIFHYLQEPGARAQLAASCFCPPACGFPPLLAGWPAFPLNICLACHAYDGGLDPRQAEYLLLSGFRRKAGPSPNLGDITVIPISSRRGCCSKQPDAAALFALAPLLSTRDSWAALSSPP